MHYIAVISKIIAAGIFAIIPILATITLTAVLPDFIKERKKSDFFFMLLLIAVEIMGRLAVLKILFSEVLV